MNIWPALYADFRFDDLAIFIFIWFDCLLLHDRRNKKNKPCMFLRYAIQTRVELILDAADYSKYTAGKINRQNR